MASVNIEVKATEIDGVKDIISSFICMLEDTRIDEDIRRQHLNTCKLLKEKFYVEVDK